MKLKTYLEKHHILAVNFATSIGVSEFAVFKWMQGQRVPRPAHIAAIQAATKGQVRYEDFAAEHHAGVE